MSGPASNFRFCLCTRAAGHTLPRVSDSLPVVSVIIPAPPGQVEVTAAREARQLDYPSDLLEILVARGRQPSIQRNAALKSARGELIYFLDDDAVPLRSNLRRMAAAFSDPEVVMMGGPNLCPTDAPWLEQVFGLVLSSWLAFGPSRARYARVGLRRHSSEKELILCNLAARRRPMLELGGFDEALYPNEENALMDELRKKGGKLIYDPDFVVHRRPRRTVGSFARMAMSYGRGRAEQFRLHPTWGSALNFVPPLFCLYLVLWPLLGSWGIYPLAAYALAVLIQAGVLMFPGGPLKAMAAMPLIVLTQVMYGLGFWRGLFTRLSREGASLGREVEVDVVQEGGGA